MENKRKMRVEDLIRLINSSDYKTKNLLLKLYPISGWYFEVVQYITDIICDEGVVYISNAFSDQNRKLTGIDAMRKLKEFDKDFTVIFEIYSLDKNGINNQIVITPIYLDESDDKMQYGLSTTNDSNTIILGIGVDKLDLSFNGE